MEHFYQWPLQSLSKIDTLIIMRNRNLISALVFKFTKRIELTLAILPFFQLQAQQTVPLRQRKWLTLKSFAKSCDVKSTHWFIQILSRQKHNHRWYLQGCRDHGCLMALVLYKESTAVQYLRATLFKARTMKDCTVPCSKWVQVQSFSQKLIIRQARVVHMAFKDN